MVMNILEEHSVVYPNRLYEDRDSMVQQKSQLLTSQITWSHNLEEYNFEVSCEGGREERRGYSILRFTDIMLQSSIL